MFTPIEFAVIVVPAVVALALELWTASRRVGADLDARRARRRDEIRERRRRWPVLMTDVDG